MTMTEAGIREALRGVCDIYTTEPPHEHEVNVTFVNLAELLDFIKSNRCENAFVYEKKATREDYYITAKHMSLYGAEATDEDKEEIRKYNEGVNATDFDIPVEVGVFVTFGGVIYRYSVSVNADVLRYRMSTQWEKIDFFIEGGKACVENG